MRDPSWLEHADEIRAKEGIPAPRTGVAAAAPHHPDLPPPGDDRPYEGAWAEYRSRWRNVWITTVLGWLFVAGAAVLLPRVGAGRVMDVLFPLWMLSWLATSLYAMLKIMTFPCPRCGRTFFSPFVSPLLQSRCRSCGLPKGAASDKPPVHHAYR